MNEYIFILGRSIKLCKAELETVLASYAVDYELVFLNERVFHIKAEGKMDFIGLGKVLGGVVKICRLKGILTGDEDSWVEEIGKMLVQDAGGGRIEFGLSFYNSDINFKRVCDLGLGVKRYLKDRGYSARVVLPKEGVEISGVAVKKQKLRELVVVAEKRKFLLGETFWGQDFELWNKKDYRRPCADIKKGMLPPKVARMMVNLGLAVFADFSDKVLLDPFCGVGTILAEGMQRGLDVVGIDLSNEQIKKTRKNLAWFKKEFDLDSEFKLYRADAVRVSEIVDRKIDFIVTEPYLGPLGLGEKKLNWDEVKKVIDELEELYERCLADWSEVLADGGAVIIILPSFDLSYLGKGEVEVKNVVDNREKLSYNLVAGPYKYRRPEAVVVRNIYILNKKNGSY